MGSHAPATLSSADGLRYTELERKLKKQDKQNKEKDVFITGLQNALNIHKNKIKERDLLIEQLKSEIEKLKQKQKTTTTTSTSG